MYWHFYLPSAIFRTQPRIDFLKLMELSMIRNLRQNGVSSTENPLRKFKEFPRTTSCDISVKKNLGRISVWRYLWKRNKELLFVMLAGSRPSFGGVPREQMPRAPNEAEKWKKVKHNSINYFFILMVLKLKFVSNTISNKDTKTCDYVILKLVANLNWILSKLYPKH